MRFSRSSSSDNSSFSHNDREQLAANATVGATSGNADDRSQAQNTRWALAEDTRNQEARPN